jgi:hypothetical protein
MKDKSTKTIQKGESSRSLPFHLFLLKFIYNYSYWSKITYFPIYVWTEGHIPFRCFTGVINTGKTPKGSTSARLRDDQSTNKTVYCIMTI